MKQYLKNKMNTLLSVSAIFAVLAMVGVFMQSCNDDVDYLSDNQGISLYKEYLWVDKFSYKTTFSEEEKAILKEAMKRVTMAIENNQMGYVVVNKTAQQLNIAEDIYNVFNDIVSLGNQQKVSFKQIRLKSGTESSDWDLDPCDWAYNYINDYLQSQPGASFSSICFSSYWSGNGSDMNLSSTRFNDIKTYIPNRNNSSGLQQVTINGATYYQGVNNFYNTPYALSLGSATIIYDTNYNPVGLSDTYNFDSQNWGNRPLDAEAMTRAVNIAGTICGASSYNIYYGIH